MLVIERVPIICCSIWKNYENIYELDFGSLVVNVHFAHDHIL